MWISRKKARQVALPLMRPALQASALAIVLALLPEWVAIRTGRVLVPHPGWIVVLLLATRHGTRGFLAGTLAAACAVTVGAAIAGTDLVRSWSTHSTAADLTSLGACLAASWIGSWHLRHERDLAEGLRVTSARAAAAEASLRNLGHVAAL